MLEAEVINKIVFVISLMFLALLILGAYGDLATRWAPSKPQPKEHSAEIVVPDWHEEHEVGHGAGAAHEGAGGELAPAPGAAAHE